METILFLLIVLMWSLLLRQKKVKKAFVILIIVLNGIAFILSFIAIDVRWQLVPLYVSFFLLFGSNLYILLYQSPVRQRRLVRILFFVLTGVLIVISGVSEYVFPLYDIPQPNGAFLIGTESFVLVDDTREEIYGEEDNRRIKIQMWYPAETVTGYEQVPWLEDGKVVAQALAIDTGLPFFVLNHTAQIMSNSYKNAPLSDASTEYPIVIISHGWRGFRNLHTDLAEELASFGYIVVSIDHTYGSVATVFSDDDIAFLNLEALPNREDTPDFIDYANTLVHTYAGDITRTINELEHMNSGVVSSQFTGHLDINNIGLLGHSTGGGAGAAVAIGDDRIKAIFGMDSWVEPLSDSEIEQGLDIPVVFVRSEAWEEGLNNTNLLRLVDDNLSNTRLYQIKGTTHYDFSMAYMYSPLTKPLGMTGELEGEYLVSIFTSMLFDFFEQTLKVDNNVGLIIIEDRWDELLKLR